mgnify:FL=1
MIDIPKTPGPIPATGICGVGRGVGEACASGRDVGVGVLAIPPQIQSDCSTHEAFLHAPSLQVRLLGHSLSDAQTALHWDMGVGDTPGGNVGVTVAVAKGVPVGVFVGVEVGVWVGVDDGVPVSVGVIDPVGVGVGLDNANVSVHAGATA